MKTIEINLYKFEELSNDSQQKAIESNYDINVIDRWWDFIYDDAKAIGLKITSFELNRNTSGNLLLPANEVAQNIFNNHGEKCDTFNIATSFMKVWKPIFSDYMDETSEKYESEKAETELLELEDNFLNSLLETYLIILQNECEYLQSTEACKETLISNEYDFTENGLIY